MRRKPATPVAGFIFTYNSSIELLLFASIRFTILRWRNVLL
nr:MAG TPA: hypothetical protein [Crassvirales sp.]